MSKATAAIAEREPSLGTLLGVFGRPYVALDDLFDLSGFDEIDDAGCVGLERRATRYTGGSQRAMGIMPKACEAEALVDYQEVVRGLDGEGFATFRSLADDPSSIDPARRRELEFGEE